ncbi:15052_t:CDS:10 [Acaulospora morrowiae]|uniref:15052_t:CDS:1 n=1 Tax=Acaulospora morrowiae TaxID=94023 RepID=A0A9N9BBG9_9GLOM|nr:15052_t:CDS:10 [Acaulospora morrowiae]
MTFRKEIPNEVSPSNEQKIPVYLNVYDMLPPGKLTDFGYMIGIGVFHSGVEVLDKGHEFDTSGVFLLRPKVGPPNVSFKESYLMGYTSKDKEEIKSIIDELSNEWSGNSYNLLTRNCNHFSSELCIRLVGKPAPSKTSSHFAWVDWVNRAARLGKFFPCVVPNDPEFEEDDKNVKSVVDTNHHFT